MLFVVFLLLGGWHSSTAIDGGDRGRIESYRIKVRIVNNVVCREIVNIVCSMISIIL